jgi:hypothetical protein
LVEQLTTHPKFEGSSPAEISKGLSVKLLGPCSQHDISLLFMNGPHKLVFYYTRMESLAKDKHSSLLGHQ